MLHRTSACGLLLLFVCSLPGVQLPGDGADFAIAGAGVEAGKFTAIRDITFGADGRLYVLDLRSKDARGQDYAGGGRVQIFAHDGALLGTFSVVDPALGERDTPTRIAVDAHGGVYVTKPNADSVQRYVDGKADRSYHVPAASAVAVGKLDGHEVVAAAGSLHAIVDGKWTWLGGEKLHLIDPISGAQKDIPLPKRLFAISDMAIGPGGDVHVVANDYEPQYDEAGLILVFAADGSLKRTFGLGGMTRAEDGSELRHSVAVDRTGRVYSMTSGNPGRVVRFDADGTSVVTRPGQFAWADPWSMHSSYTPLAIDPDDRLWIASTPLREGAEGSSHPAILRVRSSFFTEEGRDVQRHPTTLLGFKPEIRTALPYDIAYAPGEVTAQVVFPASRRVLHDAVATWRVLDQDKRSIATGIMPMTLVDGAECAVPFTFHVERFGWYLIECSFVHAAEPLDAIVKSFGVTPPFPGLPVLAAGDAPGGWEDIPRHLFCGLPNVRLHPHKDKVDELVALATQGKRDGATVIVQFFSGKDQVDIAFAKLLVGRLKGIVTYYELVNEPNFTMSPEELATLAKELSPALKAIDPAIAIMGPTVCGLDLEWIRRFFAAGGGPFIDIVAVHDYEGHESITPEHWRWKFAELRKLMALNGHGDTPIWQTERAISVIRGGLLMPMAQAARLTLQSDLLETLGIPREHNNHYYLNEGGYDSVPSYVWSATGPFPAALASRTRQAMVGGRHYDGQLDFGVSGNALFMGLRHVGQDGSTITLRNLGTIARKVDFRASGDAVEIVDSWGNRQREAITSGTLRLTLGQMPCYVRLATGQTLTAPLIDYGRNIAATANISFVGEHSGDLERLTNGVLETYHAGNPLGGTGGERIWSGAPPTAPAPRVLELRWPSPRAIHAVMVYGVEADNGFCALIDYDLQVESPAGTWETVDTVRVPLPPTDIVRTSKSLADSWYVRSNRFAHAFAPVDTCAIRLLIRRTTFGFAADEIAAQQVRKAWGGAPAAATMLREIEVYAAPSPITLKVASAGALASRPGAPTMITATVSGLGGRSCAVALRLPPGWNVKPEHCDLLEGVQGTFALTLPDEVPAGNHIIDAVASADGSHLATSAIVVRIPGTLDVRVEPVAAIQVTGQVVTATVTNHGERPVAGVVRLHLEGTSLTSSEQSFGPLASGNHTAVVWTIPGLDLTAAAVTAHVTAIAEGVATSAAGHLGLREWQVLGPFTGDERDAALIADLERGRLDLAGSYPDAFGGVRTWSVVRAPGERPEQLDLAAAVKGSVGTGCYAAIWIHSPIARPVRLDLQGKDGSVRAWLDSTAIREPEADGTSPGVLAAGWNRLVIASSRLGNDWKITTLLRDSGGDALTDLVYAAHPGQ